MLKLEGWIELIGEKKIIKKHSALKAYFSGLVSDRNG